MESARRERPTEVAVLLGLTRIGVLLVAVGGVLVLAFGLWLAGLEGNVAPRLAPRPRGRRRGFAAASSSTTGPPRALNYASGALVLAILFLMVWKPGAG